MRRLCLCRVGASEAGPAWGLLQVSLSIQSSRPHRWPSTRPQATPRGRRFPQASSGRAASSDQRTDVLTPLPEWPHSETGSVQLELAKTRSGLRWGGPMSPLSL